DTSIANVSIPAIAGDLGVSPNQGTWTITSFAVANAISVPLTGWLTQRYGQVRLFLATTALFVIASLLCGLAVSMPMLVFFRVVQGAVAGPMIPLSQTLLLSTYPREKAGMALAMFSLTILVAPVVGPVLGGWITDNFSWPWIFFINVPVGVASLAMTWMLYRDRETPRVKTPIDIAGLVLLVVWVGALQLMRSEEHTSELQSPCNLVCRLLLEKKNTKQQTHARRFLCDHGVVRCPTAWQAHRTAPSHRGGQQACRFFRVR